METWTIRPREGGQNIDILDGQGNKIALAGVTGRYDPAASRKLAVLMAAAPVMLDALERGAERLAQHAVTNDDRALLGLFRAAITQAYAP